MPFPLHMFQIYFILTGECGNVYDDDYQVYYKLASATQGKVFKDQKANIRDVSFLFEY